jgi:hypothetical protein
MGKFKIGDRVKMAHKVDGNIATCAATVVHDDISGSYPLAIEFDEKQEFGHGASRHAKEGFGWWVDHDDLIPLALAPAVAKWEPKVGDRVRVVKHCNWHGATIPMQLAVGSEHTIEKETAQLEERGIKTYLLSGGENNFYTAQNLELVTPPATITIEAGRYYKTRDGRKVGPTTKSGDWCQAVYAFRIGDWYVRKDGVVNLGFALSPESDLVAEWVEPVKPAVPAAKFKVGDRVRGVINPIEYVIIGVRADGSVDVRQPGSWCQYTNQRAQDFEPIVTASTAIVALIENGVPKPSERPFVHQSEEAATKEAERLAGKHRGQRFGIYVLADTRETDQPNYDHEWQRMAAEGQKIYAIKELRGLTGQSLKSAKDAVEYFLAAA